MTQENPIVVIQEMIRQNKIAVESIQATINLFKPRYEAALDSHDMEQVNDLYPYVILNKREISRLNREIDALSALISGLASVKQEEVP